MACSLQRLSTLRDLGSSRYRAARVRTGAFSLAVLFSACGYGGNSVEHNDGKQSAAARPEGASSGGSPGAGGSTGAAWSSKRRHVIIMIGDGMQLAHEIAASRYMTGRDDGLTFHAFPTHVFKTTWDVHVYDTWAASRGVGTYFAPSIDPKVGCDPAIGGSKPYPLLPDNAERREYFLNGPWARSSSTGTAMSTGMKTDSDNLAWYPGDPPNGALETSAELLRRLYGMSIGFVTTGPINHATPGAWFSHNVTRDDYVAVGHEMLTKVRPNVMIGGRVSTEGSVGYVAPGDIDTASGEYVVVQRTPGVDGDAAILAAAAAANQGQKKLLGLFGAEDGNFRWPVPQHQPGVPKFELPPMEELSFASASVAALEVLAQDPDGFFALLEQEDIDLVNHDNDFSRMVGCVHDLDEAVKAVVAFVERPGDAVDWSNTTLLVTADHAKSYLRLERKLGSGELPQQDSVESGWSYPDGSISYGTHDHTNELIAVYARGGVADQLASYATVYPGISDVIDDTSIYRLTLDAARPNKP